MRSSHRSLAATVEFDPEAAETRKSRLAATASVALRCKLPLVGGALVGATMLAFGGTALAVPTPVGLGTATNASVLSAADPTNSGPSTISGDASSSPNTGGTMPGFGACPGANCVTYGVGAEHLHDGTATQQVADETAAHIATAALLGATPIPAALANQSLTAGLYSTGAALLANNSTLTLDAANNPNSVWIFQVASTITTGNNSAIVFINTGGATTDQLACNVFWTAGAAATLNSGSTFVGTVMATSGVSVTAGVTVHGRLFGGTSGSVTLDTDTINSGNCRVLPAGTGGGPAGSGGGTGFTGGGLGTGGGTAVSFPGSPATPMLAAPQTAG